MNRPMFFIALLLWSSVMNCLTLSSPGYGVQRRRGQSIWSLKIIDASSLRVCFDVQIQTLYRPRSYRRCCRLTNAGVRHFYF